jgi:anterior pharynx defective protein 1
MGYLTVLGCLLIAFGPSVAFFTLVLAKRATLVILAIGAAFAWLCGMFLASMLWYALVPARGSLAVTAVVAVLSTELTRFLYWLVWTKGHQSLNQDAGKRLESETMLGWEAVAAGVGSGFGGSLLYAGMLWAAWGPGTLSNARCFGASVFVVGAVGCLMWSALQVFWTLAWHRAYRRGSWPLAAATLAHHALLSVLSVFNSGQFGDGVWLCLVPLLSQLFSVAALAVLAWRGIKKAAL